MRQIIIDYIMLLILINLNNLLNKERVFGKLNTQLSGKIELFLDEELVI